MCPKLPDKKFTIAIVVIYVAIFLTMIITILATNDFHNVQITNENFIVKQSLNNTLNTTVPATINTINLNVGDVTTKENATTTNLYQETIQEETTEETTIQEETVNSYSDTDLYNLTHLIYGESSGCSYEHQLYVGSVVLNRVNDNRFPNTIEDVIFQKGQYACIYDGNFNKLPDTQAETVAKFLLENGSQIPENVIFQANFIQGKGVWKQIGNTYFCY